MLSVSQLQGGLGKQLFSRHTNAFNERSVNKEDVGWGSNVAIFLMWIFM